MGLKKKAARRSELMQLINPWLTIRDVADAKTIGGLLPGAGSQAARLAEVLRLVERIGGAKKALLLLAEIEK